MVVCSVFCLPVADKMAAGPDFRQFWRTPLRARHGRDFWFQTLSPCRREIWPKRHPMRHHGNHGIWLQEMATGLVTRTYGEAPVYQRADWRWRWIIPSKRASRHRDDDRSPSHRTRMRAAAATLLTPRADQTQSRTNEPSCSPGVAMSCRSRLPASAKWAPRWLEAIHVTPSAYNTDAAAVRRIVDMFAIGGVKLSDLQPEHVYKVAAKIRAGKLSTSTAPLSRLPDAP